MRERALALAAQSNKTRGCYSESPTPHPGPAGQDQHSLAARRPTPHPRDDRHVDVGPERFARVLTMRDKTNWGAFVRGGWSSGSRGLHDDRCIRGSRDAPSSTGPRHAPPCLAAPRWTRHVFVTMGWPARCQQSGQQCYLQGPLSLRSLPLPTPPRPPPGAPLPAPTWRPWSPRGVGTLTLFAC